MSKRFPFLLLITLIILTACQSDAPACQWGTGTPHFMQEIPEPFPSPSPMPILTPVPMEIGRKTLLVDRIVEGPLCNDAWSGTIYVTCNVQVLEWVEEPLFLKDCDLAIQPGSVVYVAYHNDTAYYKGCSCHTGVEVDP